MMRLIVAEGFSPSSIFWKLQPLATPEHNPLFINILQLLSGTQYSKSFYIDSKMSLMIPFLDLGIPKLITLYEQ